MLVAVILALPRTSVPVLVLYVPVYWGFFALSAKRLHDRGKSAWWLLLLFVPLFGFLWLLVELPFLPGTAGENSYGPDPLTSGGDYLVVK